MQLIFQLLIYFTYMIAIINFGFLDINKKKTRLQLIALAIPTVILLRYSEPLAQVFFICFSTYVLKSQKRPLFSSFIVSLSSVIFLILFSEMYSIITTYSLSVLDIHLVRGESLIFLMITVLKVFLIYITCFFISKKIIKADHTAIKMDKRQQFIIITLGMFIFISIYGSIFYVVDGQNITYLLMFFFIIVFSLFLILLYFVYTSSLKEQDILKKEMAFEQLEAYTENLEFIYKDMKKLRHDYTNVLSSMTGYMSEGNLEGLIDYFEENIIPFNENMKRIDFKLMQLSNIKQTELKGLLSLKIMKAEDHNIDVCLDIDKDIDFLEMDRMDLCRIMGIVLDNAIEAALESKHPYIQVGLLMQQNHKVIIIENSTAKAVPNVYSMFQDGFSTKGENRGIGLSNLREIINRYDTFTLETLKGTLKFTQLITYSK